MAGSMLLGSSILLSLSILYLNAGRCVMAAQDCLDPQPPYFVRAQSQSSTTFSLTWSASGTNPAHCMVGFHVCLHHPSGDTDCVFVDCRSLGGCGKTVSWTNDGSTLRTVACAKFTTTVAVVSDYLGVDGRISRARSATFQSAPDGVTGLLAAETTANSTRLEWDTFSSPCTDHFLVSWCSVAYPWSPVCSPQSQQLTTDQTSYNITNLNPCTTYHISVATVSGKSGPINEATLTMTTSSTGVMGSVEHLSLSVSGDQVGLYWEPNPKDRTCIAAYEICWWEEEGNETCSEDEPDAELDLEFCTSYNVSVRAVDVANTTSQPVVQQVHTGAGEVRNLTVTEVTSRSTMVAWEPAPSSDICGSGYVLAWCTQTDADDPPCEPRDAYNVSLDTTSCNVTGLMPCLPHRVAVRTVSDNGFESAARIVVVHTLLEEFAAPRVTRVDVETSAVTMVEFSPPVDSGDCVSGYIGCLRRDDAPDEEPVCLLANNDRYWTTWDNHTTPCTNYTLQLTAFSSDGRNASTTVSFTSGAGDVEELRAHNVTSNSTSWSSARLTWTVASPDVCVDQQLVTWSRADGQGNSSEVTVSTGAREVVLDGLEPCTEYEARIQQRASTPSVSAISKFYSTNNARSVSDLKISCEQGGIITEVFFVAPDSSTSCVASYSVCWGHLTTGPSDNTSNSSSSSAGDAWSCQVVTGSGTLSAPLPVKALAGGYGVSITPVAPDGREYNAATIPFTPCSGCARISPMRNTLLVLLVINYHYLLRRLQPCSS